MFKPISVSLLPNTFKKDVRLARQLFFKPNEWLRGEEVDLLEKEFGALFPRYQAISFASGRTALLAILKSLGVKKGDEVLLQSFTCVVVANAVLKLGATPVYVDIKKGTYNLDPDDLAKKIRKRAKVIIIQHTFGFPAPVDEILEIAKKNKLKVIEDCAHGIGISYKRKKLGTFGEASFFSFGRDKALSSVFGGIALTKSVDLEAKIREYRKALPHPPTHWVGRQLLYPILFSSLLPVYNFASLGKVILVISQKLKLLSLPVWPQEKRGLFPKELLARMPNGLAALARFQLKRLKSMNQSRKKWVRFYAQQLKDLPLSLPQYQLGGKTIPLLRFTIQIQDPQRLYQFTKGRGVLLNNWYFPAISPAGTDHKAIGYQAKKCRVAEASSYRVVNLPTHPKLKPQEAEKVVTIIKEFFNVRS